MKKITTEFGTLVTKDCCQHYVKKDGVTTMQAKKIFLETDQYGQLLHQPNLPPNSRIEAIFLIIEDKMKEKKRRKASSKILGKGKIMGDIISPISPIEDWEALQ